MASQSDAEPHRRGRDPNVKSRCNEKASQQSGEKQESSTLSERETKEGAAVVKWECPSFLQWIPQNWTWTKIKPVIRCAIHMWVSALLFIIPSVQRVFGQVCPPLYSLFGSFEFADEIFSGKLFDPYRYVVFVPLSEGWNATLIVRSRGLLSSKRPLFRSFGTRNAHADIRRGGVGVCHFVFAGNSEIHGFFLGGAA